MNDLDVAVSVLAAVAFPLVGIGPMLLRLLRVAGYVIWVLASSGVVLMLTGQAWAAAFTACVAVTAVLPRCLPRPERGARASLTEDGSPQR
jgi:hypothetical protein